MIDSAAIQRCYMTKEVMKHVLSAVHGELLDFGSGSQKYRALFEQKATSYTSFDIDPASGAQIIGSVLDPRIADSSFDTIVSNQVLEHVRQPWLMVQNIGKILRPGGTCILTAPFMIPFHADPDDYFRFTESGMRSLCEDAGLRIELCSRYGGWPAIAGETLKQKYFSHYIPRSWMSRRLGRAVESLCWRLNRFIKPRIAYTNVVCIAHKPL